jgi:hypothetical protein
MSVPERQFELLDGEHLRADPKIGSTGSPYRNEHTDSSSPDTETVPLELIEAWTQWAESRLG